MNAHAEKDDCTRAERSRRFLEQLAEAKKDPIACLVADRETSAAIEALEQALAHVGARKDCSDFKAHLLLRDFHPNTTLLGEIVARIKIGGENLDILIWAQTEKKNLNDTFEILRLLDINSRRMTFWP